MKRSARQTPMAERLTTVHQFLLAEWQLTTPEAQLAVQPLMLARLPMQALQPRVTPAARLRPRVPRLRPPRSRRCPTSAGWRPTRQAPSATTIPADRAARFVAAAADAQLPAAAESGLRQANAVV